MRSTIVMSFVTVKSTFAYLFIARLGLGCAQDGSSDSQVTGVNYTPTSSVAVPICRQMTTHGMPFAPNEARVIVGNYPWHASLYAKKDTSPESKKDFVCGATIIHNKFLLTAAHCVYDETTRTTKDPKTLFVMTGNRFQNYGSPFHNPVNVKKCAVKDVHVHCQYHGLFGNYASDIALLELQKPFEFSDTLLPACLYASGYDEQTLEPGAYGKIAGFGQTERELSSSVLVTLRAPYVPYDQCRSSVHDEQNYALMTPDKFCAGYTNGSATCEGDTGGGLVFKKNDGWYVEGILSYGLSVTLPNDKKTCDPFSYGLYVRVPMYTKWIQDTISMVEQHKPIPSCNLEE